MSQTARDRQLEEWFANPPRIWNAPELLATEFPAPRWAVEGLLAEGLNLLAGAPKVGKSWLALAVAIAVASGGRALGKIKVDQGPVLYLALEDKARRLKHRLNMVLKDDQPPALLHFATEWPRMTDGGADRLREWLVDHPETRLVVVDVLARMRGVANPRESLYASDYLAMEPLKAVLDEFSVAGLAVHHTRKMASEDFVDTVSGSQGLAGASDAVLVMKRARTTADAVLSISGRDVEEAQYALTFNAACGTWTLLDDPPAVLDMGETRRRVLDLLGRTGSLPPATIAAELGIKHDLAKQTVKRMADDGQLDVSDGIYCVPLSLLSPQSPNGDNGDTGDSSAGLL